MMLPDFEIFFTVVKVNGYDATVKKISKSGSIITLIPLSNDPIHEPKIFTSSAERS
jgi:repressor LexA